MSYFLAYFFALARGEDGLHPGVPVGAEVAVEGLQVASLQHAVVLPDEVLDAQGGVEPTVVEAEVLFELGLGHREDLIVELHDAKLGEDGCDVVWHGALRVVVLGLELPDRLGELGEELGLSHAFGVEALGFEELLEVVALVQLGELVKE